LGILSARRSCEITFGFTGFLSSPAFPVEISLTISKTGNIRASLKQPLLMVRGGSMLHFTAQSQQSGNRTNHGGQKRMPFRTAFLIVSAGVILHITVLPICGVLIGYTAFASLDKWLAHKRRESVIDYEIHGWVVDPEDPESENKGNLSRVKLPGKEQIVVARVAELLRRIR
jgi:hypothetical protein